MGISLPAEWRMKLSVIAPTFNERENIRALVEQVQDALPDMLYEIIIADDDSPDLTWQMAQEISARDPKVRVLRRTRNHGLGRAVMEGFTAAAGDIVACMDADLQHDPSVLPKMLEKLTRGADVVIGRDRKSTRLNSSHLVISYAVFCLKKKKKSNRQGD